VTIKVKQVGFAQGVVEDASMPAVAGVDSYKAWSMLIHNIGEAGIFGGAIMNFSGPGDIVILRKEQETVMPPSSTVVLIFHFTEAQPNCTRLDIDGEIKFMAEGTYKIRIHAVHLENTDWYSDDYVEFTVVVSVAEETCSVEGKVTGFFDIMVGGAGAIVALNGEKRETNTAGEYAFIKLPIGSYKLTVTKEPWYEPYEKDLSLTVVGKEYVEDVSLSLKSYIKYGVPLSVVVGGVGGVIVVRKARAPTDVYKVPPGYEVIPKAPPGFRLVKE